MDTDAAVLPLIKMVNCDLLFKMGVICTALCVTVGQECMIGEDQDKGDWKKNAGTAIPEILLVTFLLTYFLVLHWYSVLCLHIFGE